MKKAISIIALCLTMIMTVGLGTIAFAAETSDTSTAVESASERTGRTRIDKTERSNTKVSVISVAASVLGQPEDEVKEYVKTGKVGDLLIKAGKVEDFKTAYLAEAKTKLDTAVSAGTLTQVQADEKYAEAQSKMSAYDGTTHLCGGTDHSRMSERSNKQAKDSSNTL